MIQEPIILGGDGGADVFRTKEEAERFTEPVDIENGEYVAYDAADRLLDLGISAERPNVMHLSGCACVQSAIATNKAGVRHMTAISSPKQATLQLVERLEDDVTFEDIIYELYVLEKIQRGMKDAEEGRLVSHEEARQRLSRWLK